MSELLKRSVIFLNLKYKRLSLVNSSYEILFHWQSQNKTRSDDGKGLTYINHQKLGKKILLFVREAKSNQYGNTQGYVFIGEANFIKYEGSKPMSITWELKEPIPNYLWKDSAKLLIG